ncbi:MAG: HD-GYP domain-containing protein [Chromatiales bacterium]|nr:HD-GYP domain-containing protein [Chromatiales bacterium]
MQIKPLPQIKIVIIYVIAGSLWIYFSDMVIGTLFSSAEAITAAQNIKGWFFIAITGVILFYLINRSFNDLTRANREVVESYEQTMHGWVQVMDLRHKETKNHTERVTAMTVRFAKLAGITDEKELKNIERGAMLHDVGKIGIPDAILIKPGKLNEEEWDQIKLHPIIAHDLLSKIKFLQNSLDIPYCHHEKWDGSGYPRAIKAEEIPLPARIFAIIDVWDALSHARVYKAAWREEMVLEHIAERAGQHFDPALVKIFKENYDQIKEEG